MTAAPVIELLGPAVGGIRSHVIELTHRLRDRGTAVVVAGPPHVLGPDVAVDAIVDVPSWPSPIGVLAARRQLAAVLADTGADVVHAHGLKAGWVAVSTRPRPRVVLTAHNVVLPGTRGATLLRSLERGVVRRVDRLIAPSHAIADGFASLLPDARRTVILPVSPPAAAPRPRHEVRAELGVADDAQLVVVAARLHPQKDLATFVRAMRRVRDARPDVVARIVGEGRSRASITALIEAEGLSDRVGLVGESPRAVDQMAAADVVALSSTWEAVPLVVVEAMALGVPVATTRVGIVDEVITTGESGWVVDVGDAAALGDAIVAGLSDPSGLATIGERGRQSVAQLADPDALTSAVLDVYRSLGASVGA